MAPLDRINVDTDQIVPKQFLKRVERSGYGAYLFYDWAHRPDGTPDPDFILNQPRFAGAVVLVAGANFGCGSSREHAPQAIRRRGIRAVVGQSFSEIFFGNSIALGMPCPTASAESLRALMEMAERDPRTAFVVDLESMRISASGQSFDISLPAAAREAFADGSWDATGLLVDDFDAVRRVASRLPYIAGAF